jgi:hypothetical protein
VAHEETEVRGGRGEAAPAAWRQGCAPSEASQVACATARAKERGQVVTWLEKLIEALAVAGAAEHGIYYPIRPEVPVRFDSKGAAPCDERKG